MSDPELWIVIRNWERFQHADVTRSIAPPWIKNYTRLMSDDNYLQLSGHRRAILHGLWLEYASSTCRLRLDTRSLTRRLNLRVTTRDLESLNHAGFLEFLQAPRKQDSSTSRARQEVEVEEEKIFSSDVGKAKSMKPREAERASTYSPKANVQPKDPAAAIAAMIRNGVIADLVDLEAELAGYRLEPAAEDELRALFEITAAITSLSGGA